MAMLVALAPGASPVQARDGLLRQALACARHQGYGEPVVLRWQGGCALWFDTPANPGTGGACLQQGPRFAAYVGSVHAQGRTGAALLRGLMQGTLDPRELPLRDWGGSFTLLWGDRQQAWLFNDAVGLQKTYVNAAQTLYSTSLYLCRSGLQQPRLNRLRAQEYVLLGSNHGLETPLQDIRLCDPTQALNLANGTAVSLHAAKDWRVDDPPATFEAAVKHGADRLADDARSMLDAFGSDVGMALSGGFDSRLILAALDHHGVSPALYVYGADADSDVQIARAKAAELGLPIDSVDKGRRDADLPPLDRARLKLQLAAFDGLPTDGVFDRGVDLETRRLQVQHGRLNLNGGGGEILRNFFYIRDGTYTADDIVGVFYSNWIPQALPSDADRGALRLAMGQGILRALGRPDDAGSVRQLALSRSEVELIYTLVRLRFWMGRNNAVAAQHGNFITPLPQPRLAAWAAQVPLHWKTCGVYQSAVIQRLSPRVAQGPSSYGFSFAQGPELRYRLGMQGTLWRPVALRRASTALRHRLGRTAVPTLPAEWARAYEAPAVDWLDTACLNDDAQLNRLMTLCAFLDDSMAGVPAGSASVQGLFEGH
jgi:hypothetical protein